MKKVLEVEITENQGGIESFLLSEAPLNFRGQVRIDYFAATNHPVYEAQFLNYGGKIFKNDSTWNKVGRLISLINREAYDIVHFNKNSLADSLAIIGVKVFTNAKIIIHAHNTRPTHKGVLLLLIHYLNRWVVAKMADELVACSTEAGKFMFGKEKFLLIPNGIDTDKYVYKETVRVEKRNELHIGLNSVVYICVARFTEQKNQIYLLDLFAEILKINPNSVLLLVGDGPLMSSVRMHAEAKGVLAKVMFLGPRDDVNQLLIAADAFLMFSLFEGLPIAAVEAQAAGCKVFLSENVSLETKLTDNVSFEKLATDNQQLSVQAQQININVTANVQNNSRRREDNDKVRRRRFSSGATRTSMENLFKQL